jgi:hypothetical protein
VRRGFYARGDVRDLRPALLVAAAGLVLADLIAALALRGAIRWPRRRRLAAGAALVLAGAASLGVTSRAAAETIPPAALETRLAYVQTGNADVDATVRDGLRGISVIVNRRSAAALAPPVGVRPGVDSLALYPLLYWPLIDGAPAPDGETAAVLAAYLENGGVVLFDSGLGGGPGGGAFAETARALNLPTLVPAPDDHVLGRSFYLLASFPGRWAGGTLWVERADERINDGVSAVIAGANGWAGAWAMDEAQRFLFPVVPGGEAQREVALRFGVNLVMYVLTGNYKADQVHVPAILERLKQ